ncbi:MAG: tetratricopeptide repeat protein [Acidimicrobiia bacterium]|nr:tetratricopeptide repeat protein [Acidimicrobiia bacterium]
MYSQLLIAQCIDPNYGEAYAHLARLFYLVGNWESFRPTIHRAIELQPDNFLACYYYGQLILLEGGDKAQERALEYFEKSVRFDRSFAAGYIAIGQVWAGQGRWTEALASYRQAAQKEPRNSRVHYLMAQAYRSLGQVEEAKRSLEKAGLASR